MSNFRIQPPWNQQYVPAQLAQYGPYGPPYSNPVYDPTLKWPAVPYNAPANYYNYGKYNNDAWLLPQNVPRWYDQTDGSRLVQGHAGYLWPLFYGKKRR